MCSFQFIERQLWPDDLRTTCRNYHPFTKLQQRCSHAGRKREMSVTGRGAQHRPSSIGSCTRGAGRERNVALCSLYYLKMYTFSHREREPGGKTFFLFGFVLLVMYIHVDWIVGFLLVESFTASPYQQEQKDLTVQLIFSFPFIASDKSLLAIRW